MEVEYDPLAVLPTIGPTARENLSNAGYESVEDVRQASAEELKEVPYVGEAKAIFLKEYLQQ